MTGVKSILLPALLFIALLASTGAAQNDWANFQGDINGSEKTINIRAFIDGQTFTGDLSVAFINMSYYENREDPSLYVAVQKIPNSAFGTAYNQEQQDIGDGIWKFVVNAKVPITVTDDQLARSTNALLLSNGHVIHGTDITR